MFELNAAEEKAFEKWNKKHKKKCKFGGPLSPGTEGGRLTYCFTPTGLGCVTIIKCSCGEKCDVTDNSHW